MQEIPTTTLNVELLPQFHAIRVIPRRFATPEDVSRALARISELLNTSTSQMVVIVDLRNVPNIPLGTTINSAVDGPYTDPKLKEWLLLGSSPVALLIQKILVSITGRDNVRWFNTEQEIFDYLESSLRNN